MKRPGTPGTNHSLASVVARRLRQRSDTEHEQSIIRILIVTLLLLYFVLWHHKGSFAIDVDLLFGEQPRLDLGICVAASYLGLSIVGFLLVVLFPGSSPARRLVMMVGDFGTISLLMAVGGEIAAPLYPIYLWIAFGNGFRYGLSYLAASVAAAAVGFVGVLATSHFWNAHLSLGIGLLVALAVLPAYASTLIRKLTEAKVMAEAANQAKSRFLAAMSHELRTPLNAIIGTSDLLHETPLNRDQQEMIHTVKASGSALLALIDDILDLSRIEAGKTPTTYEGFDLHREVGDIVSIVRQQAQRKGLRLGVDVSPHVPFLLHGDRRHLRQVLINLLTNAVKFTNEGYVLLHIELADDQNGDAIRVRFDVRDTGIGISADDRDRIFERFTQADDAANRRYGGAGLGLAISKSLVEIMEGTISVDSKLDGGSTFHIEIPFLRQSAKYSSPIALPDRVILLSPDEELAREIAAHLASVPVAIGRSDVQGELEEGMFGAVDALSVVLADMRNGATDDIVQARLSPWMAARRVALVRLLTEGDRVEPSLTWMSTLSKPFAKEQLLNALNACVALSPGRGEKAYGEHPGTDRSQPTRSLRVLIADDNSVNRRVTARILKHAGHQPLVAESGEEALDILEDNEELDLLIVDINMPGISGLDLIRLRRMAESSEQYLPIIALSADATSETRSACEEAGVDAYLTKPIPAKQLLEASRKVARRRRDQRISTATLPSATTVTPISTHPKHPKYRADAGPALDWDWMRQLGEVFEDEASLAETLREYLADADMLLSNIESAALALDNAGFRNGIHALRGTSGNVGAIGLRQVCSEVLRSRGRIDLERHGDEYVSRLRCAFSGVRQELASSAQFRDCLNAP
jgi:two-component system sensor histidine kinase RpfC